VGKSRKEKRGGKRCYSQHKGGKKGRGLFVREFKLILPKGGGGRELFLMPWKEKEDSFIARGKGALLFGSQKWGKRRRRKKKRGPLPSVSHSISKGEEKNPSVGRGLRTPSFASKRKKGKSAMSVLLLKIRRKEEGKNDVLGDY